MPRTASQEDTPTTPAPLAAAPRPQTVLVVDDERDILDSLSDLFQATLEGVRCLTAPGGAQALEILAREPVDLILSDFKMPGMNGLEFLEKARTAAPQVPRIMMTAFPDLEIAIQAINEARIETFFTKPLDPDKVMAAVQDSLANRKAKGARDQAFSRAVEHLRRKEGGGPGASA